MSPELTGSRIEESFERWAGARHAQVKQPALRPTALQLLAHPWLAAARAAGGPRVSWLANLPLMGPAQLGPRSPHMTRDSSSRTPRSSRLMAAGPGGHLWLPAPAAAARIEAPPALPAELLADAAAPGRPAPALMPAPGRPAAPEAGPQAAPAAADPAGSVSGTPASAAPAGGPSAGLQEALAARSGNEPPAGSSGARAAGSTGAPAAPSGGAAAARRADEERAASDADAPASGVPAPAAHAPAQQAAAKRSLAAGLALLRGPLLVGRALGSGGRASPRARRPGLRCAWRRRSCSALAAPVLLCCPYMCIYTTCIAPRLPLIEHSLRARGRAGAAPGAGCQRRLCHPSGVDRAGRLPGPVQGALAALTRDGHPCAPRFQAGSTDRRRCARGAAPCLYWQHAASRACMQRRLVWRAVCWAGRRVSCTVQSARHADMLEPARRRPRRRRCGARHWARRRPSRCRAAGAAAVGPPRSRMRGRQTRIPGSPACASRSCSTCSWASRPRRTAGRRPRLRRLGLGGRAMSCRTN
jgi:hypothetical protein